MEPFIASHVGIFESYILLEMGQVVLSDDIVKEIDVRAYQFLQFRKVMCFRFTLPILSTPTITAITV